MADNKSCVDNECIRCGKTYKKSSDKPSFRKLCDTCKSEENNKHYDDPKNINAGTITIDIDCQDALKGLKAIQREAKKATAALKELEGQQRENQLLVIELDDEESVPRVFHEGKEITNKVRVHFDWKTRTDHPGKLEVNVDHYEINDNGEPNLTGIEIERLT
ncbi:hypothetical protein ACTNEO_05090 [Gracilibacillus sp. HCP3S3_G5_1]|uniref:hypothetical protein n=1 Tax=unclassified Gracilibacillus TaxID=2625209 RepID=UPI003F8A91A6